MTNQPPQQPPPTGNTFTSTQAAPHSTTKTNRAESEAQMPQTRVYLDLHFINIPEFYQDLFQSPPKFNTAGDLLDEDAKKRLKEMLLSLKAFTMKTSRGRIDITLIPRNSLRIIITDHFLQWIPPLGCLPLFTSPWPCCSAPPLATSDDEDDDRSRFGDDDIEAETDANLRNYQGALSRSVDDCSNVLRSYRITSSMPNVVSATDCGIGALTGLSVGNQQLQQLQQARQPRCAGKRHSQWRVLLDRKALLPLALRGSSCLYTAFGLKV
ncbi:hypothetical protein JHK86_010084 [Glycine max]|nr:hypothetical protein JHK86_010084 [Glycine max]